MTSSRRPVQLDRIFPRYPGRSTPVRCHGREADRRSLDSSRFRHSPVRLSPHRLASAPVTVTRPTRPPTARCPAPPPPRPPATPTPTWPIAALLSMFQEKAVKAEGSSRVAPQRSGPSGRVNTTASRVEILTPTPNPTRQRSFRTCYRWLGIPLKEQPITTLKTSPTSACSLHFPSNWTRLFVCFVFGSDCSTFISHVHMTLLHFGSLLTLFIRMKITNPQHLVCILLITTQ